MAPVGSSGSSPDTLDDNLNTAHSSGADNGDITATSPSADGTEAHSGADGITTAVETDKGNADAKEPTEREALLSVVKKALDKDKTAPEAGDSSVPSGKQGADASAKPDGGDGKKPGSQPKGDEEDTRFDKHPRFQKLRTQVSELEPKARNWDTVQSFMEAHDLTPEEVAQGYQVMALMKRDPAKAFEVLQPYMERLALFTGERLPEDLAQRVDAGEISESAAKEIAALRAGRQHSEVVSERDREREAERQTRTVTGERVNAVNTWEESKQASDPDFAAIKPLVRDRARAMIAELTAAGTPPVTPADAVKVAEDAYQAIRGQLRPLRPNRPAMRHVPSSGSTSTSAQPQPKTALDAARVGLNRARASRG